MSNNKTIYDSSEGFFEKTGSREKFHSSRFEELLFFSGTRLSVRDTSALVDQISGQKNRIIPTTVRNRLEKHGTEIAAMISEKAEEALSVEDIKAALEREPSNDLFTEPRFFADPEIIKTAAENLGVKDYNPAEYEASNESVNISVDDISVKAQKAYARWPRKEKARW